MKYQIEADTPIAVFEQFLALYRDHNPHMCGFAVDFADGSSVSVSVGPEKTPKRKKLTDARG